MPSLALPRRGAPAAPAGAPELGSDLLAASLPSPIVEAGERAAFHSVEFLTARLRNPNTRDAYGRAIAEFCRWCSVRQIALPSLSSLIVGSYFNELAQRLSPASANQHLSGIRQWLEWLTRAGVLSANPAACVRGLRLRRDEGKTPVLEREQARRLFDSLDGADVMAVRDRALLGIMLHDFVRVGAVIRMRGRDFQDHDSAAIAWIVLSEKGGKQRRLPAHHLVRDDLRAYLAAAGLRGREHSNEPLFQSAPRGAKTLSGKPLDRSSVLACHGQAPMPRRGPAHDDLQSFLSSHGHHPPSGKRRRHRDRSATGRARRHAHDTALRPYRATHQQRRRRARASLTERAARHRRVRSPREAGLKRALTWNPYPPLPLQPLRDLLGITRALYRATLLEVSPDAGRLQALEDVGTTLRAVRRAAGAHPGTIDHLNAWTAAERATKALGKLVDDSMPLGHGRRFTGSGGGAPE